MDHGSLPFLACRRTSLLLNSFLGLLRKFYSKRRKTQLSRAFQRSNYVHCKPARSRLYLSASKRRYRSTFRIFPSPSTLPATALQRGHLSLRATESSQSIFLDPDFQIARNSTTTRTIVLSGAKIFSVKPHTTIPKACALTRRRTQNRFS
jgi:hypothetical protein